MNKNAIKKFAVWARKEMITRVAGRAASYGITQENYGDPNAESIEGRVLAPEERQQRTAFIMKIKQEGYEQAVEEVAYTWFNRFCALRYMEVNGYLPSHVRVFTNDDGEFEPQILDEAIHLDLNGLDMEKVYDYKDSDQTEELYRYLLIVQCNALNSILPGIFQKIADYTELLLPDNLLREGSVIEQMVTQIPDEDWTDQVQIIGWLYQYYNAEKKDEVFAALKKNVKITKDNIPAATQVFTPDWIVRYMVENSLGRLWIEGHPNNGLKENWKYYLEEVQQEPEVEDQLEEIRKKYAALAPEDIKCIDPCCGSGHILVYMFDVLMQIYMSYGYSVQDSACSILENNLYGLDIDDRAAQLAYFSVMMKARSYDKKFFSREIQPHVYSICESNDIDQNLIDYFVGDDQKLKNDFEILLKEMYNAKEYGTILNISRLDFTYMYERVEEVKSDISLHSSAVLNMILPLIQVGQTIAQGYDVVVTNPPYMGANNIANKLVKFIKEYYPSTKSDMSTVFMEKALKMCNHNGYIAMINIPGWMFLTSFEQLRKQLLKEDQIINLLHLGRGVFGADFGTCAFVIRESNVKDYISLFKKLYSRQGAVDSEDEKIKMFFSGYGVYTNKQDNFINLPGESIAYSACRNLIKAFQVGVGLDDISEPKQGIATADNNRFLRFWYEVTFSNIKFDCDSHETALKSPQKWYPYNKGGGFKKWYGNNEYVINWEHDGVELRAFHGSVIRSPQYYFRECLSWCKVTISGFSMRFIPQGFLFDVAGCSLFTDSQNINYILGFSNSKVNAYILSILSPTVNYEVGQIASLPLLMDENSYFDIEKIVSSNIKIAREDWDSFETSWDFQHHPLVHPFSTIKQAFDKWDIESENRFNKLKANEEELNRIFIDIYGLQNELNPEEEEKNVTVHKADLQRDVKSLISYAVGCMFGRYSLDMDGLAYAGGEWDDSKYSTFIPDSDGIIPICDDEYFKDDIVGRFVEFVRIVYGEDTLEENLKFIADALGGSGTPRQVIRKYFLNDFYKDHCKIYQKRPIYWLFDSGKKNGFKCLIYMHRYQPDMVARIRTDYVHEQQARYRTAMADLQERIKRASASEQIKFKKQLTKLQGQAEELQEYEEKIHHLADQFIDINLDDGVKVNYTKFPDVLAKIK